MEEKTLRGSKKQQQQKPQKSRHTFPRFLLLNSSEKLSKRGLQRGRGVGWRRRLFLWEHMDGGSDSSINTCVCTLLQKLLAWSYPIDGNAAEFSPDGSFLVLNRRHRFLQSPAGESRPRSGVTLTPEDETPKAKANHEPTGAGRKG